MGNRKFWLRMLVLTLAFGMTVVGCVNDPTDDGGSGGSFTLINIPSEYNGKYALYITENDFPVLAGAQSISMGTGVIIPVQIYNGRVSIPMWVASDNGYKRFSGNRIVGYCEVMIINTPTVTVNTADEDILALVTFYSITFSSGNATKSWNDGEVDDY